MARKFGIWPKSSKFFPVKKSFELSLMVLRKKISNILLNYMFFFFYYPYKVRFYLKLFWENETIVLWFLFEKITKFSSAAKIIPVKNLQSIQTRTYPARHLYPIWKTGYSASIESSKPRKFLCFYEATTGTYNSRKKIYYHLFRYF